MTGSDGSDTRRLKSVNQSFKIVDYLHESGGSTLSQTAEDLDMPLSTVHIYLSTLVETGYVVKCDNEYHSSFQFLRMGGEMRDRMALFQAAKPELDDLQEKTGEHTNATVEQNGYSVQLYKSHSPESIDDDAPLGDHLHLHSTATGKAILAQLAEETVSEIVAKRGLPALTDDTITDEGVLHEELETVRERGYSINRGEHFPGVSAVGTAIVSEPDDAVGAISISGPISRMDPDRIEDELAPELLNKKNIIELKIRQYE
ncbi:IclR family transcriptional regulator [Haloarcula sp. JP-L23]|uniref:IclR family transcriptional regulator n=1 Tax=Haloarcula sp. JP-L23 TaxID=2716717 RepID=UPI00140F1AF6|nr:IclR family transcriptional regulator [Haloarcula sp. JP-L23]